MITQQVYIIKGQARAHHTGEVCEPAGCFDILQIMSGINQIQMSFIPAEDRILLRINTMDSSGFQFFMTRRYVKLLWPILLAMLSRDEQISVQQTDIAKKEVLSFQHQEATQKMDYSQDYQEQTTQQPLGDEPILLGKVAIKDRQDGTQLLCMHPETGQGVELALNQTLLHSICKLLQDTVARAEWDMDLTQTLNPVSEASSLPSRAIN